MKHLIQMYRLAVWDHYGRMYMPLYDDDWNIYSYAGGREALDAYNVRLRGDTHESQDEV